MGVECPGEVEADHRCRPVHSEDQDQHHDEWQWNPAGPGEHNGPGPYGQRHHPEDEVGSPQWKERGEPAENRSADNAANHQQSEQCAGGRLRQSDPDDHERIAPQDREHQAAELRREV